VANLKRKSSIILSAIFILAIVLLFVFNYIKLPAEFYSAFAGALAAIIFSALISYVFWMKQQRLSKDTKAQIIQTVLGEAQLNMNNVADFIKGCKEGTHFMPFITASIQKTSFWLRFITDYPHPTFELIQNFDLIYSTFLLMEYYAKELQLSLPEGMRFIPPSGVPLPGDWRNLIKNASSGHFPKWRMNVEAMIGYYDKINENLGKEFSGYEFKKQRFFEVNNTYLKLKNFYMEI
jgi:hypothetical protein